MGYGFIFVKETGAAVVANNEPNGTPPAGVDLLSIPPQPGPSSVGVRKEALVSVLDGTSLQIRSWVRNGATGLWFPMETQTVTAPGAAVFQAPAGAAMFFQVVAVVGAVTKWGVMAF